VRDPARREGIAADLRIERERGEPLEPRVALEALGAQQRPGGGEPELRREPLVAVREEDVDGVRLERHDLADAERRVLHQHPVQKIGHGRPFS